MKKVLLFLFTLLITFSASFATHLMGGEITARQLNNSLDYEVTLTAYRDTMGIPMASTATFEIFGSTGAYLFSSTVGYDSTVSGITLPNYPYGVEVYVFVDTITMPSFGDFYISWDNCCRNGAIQNMTNPLSESMWLQTHVTVDSANSTPFFLVQPVVFLPINTPWQYNPLPFDADGDSLVWSMDTSYTALNTPVTGYTTPPADPTGPFVIDPVTGTISWTANTLGNFDATVLVSEYRNGVKIGEIRRDMQFIVVQSSNRLAQITNIGTLPKNSYGYPQVTFVTGEVNSLVLYASDEDVDDHVYLEAYGESFLYQNNASTFTIKATGNGNELEGTYAWDYPTWDMARTEPYLTVFRVKDDEFAFDYTVFVDMRVGATAIEDESFSLAGGLYPNPVRDAFHVPFKLNEAAEIGLKIYNSLGMEVKGFAARQYAAGNHNIIANVGNLNTGAYFLAIEKDGRVVKAQKMMVVK